MDFSLLDLIHARVVTHYGFEPVSEPYYASGPDGQTRLWVPISQVSSLALVADTAEEILQYLAGAR